MPKEIDILIFFLTRLADLVLAYKSDNKNDFLIRKNMNSTIEMLCNHRTYRDFDPDFVLPASDLQQILQSARQAPSWMNGQHVSIILCNTSVREKIAQKAGSVQIGACSALLFFIGDLYRASVCAKFHSTDFSAVGNADTLITMVTDAALVAQNATVAAESLGYGTCVVGGVRSLCADLIDIFSLPKFTFPLFGLCIGKPTVQMRVKPRLPQEICVFENVYHTENIEDGLKSYEKTMLDFAEARETLPYREKFARFYAKNFAAKNNDLLVKQGFLTKMAK